MDGRDVLLLFEVNRVCFPHFMKKKITVLIVLSYISFFSEAPLENIDATSNNLSAVLNTTNNEIVFSVPIQTFKFKKEKMQEHSIHGI